jgi:peptidyl-prolyl cis-trans isomerase C
MHCSAVISVRAAARLLATGVLALPLLSVGARAQATAQPAGDPVVAQVDGQPIHLSDLKDAADSLPPAARGMPQQSLYPMLLDQVIDGKVLVAEARKTGVDKDPVVQHQLQLAADRALQSALLQKEIGPQITDEAVRARYDQDLAGKAGEEEVHARHILVADDATAKTIIAELKKGGDFAALSGQYSTDPGAKQQGGDLGYFKRNEMVPEFATAAFALKDGEVSGTPVHSQFGWHVIQTLEHRRAPPVPFDKAKDELRQKIIQEGVQKAVARARTAVSVEKFNLDGSRPRPTDMAEPPPAK